ncbi:S8 family serine peptidase [Yoonia sp. SS1-5]|uniref:S8 family serine peptidase n=1 Tax=Yoonia rhodophyticola TaxID=3137370 RepID=A0AAN0MC33_9RHOB
MLQDIYQALTADETMSGAEPIIIELVFEDPQTPDTVAAGIAAALPNAPVTVTSAFETPTDQFLFAAFEGIRERGQEAQIFAMARALRTALDAVEANPVLTDSTYGAAAVDAATDRESFKGLCTTEKTNLQPFGWPHKMIRTPQAWRKSRGEGARVAVIDTGHSTHQELNGAIVQTGQRNLVEGGTDAHDRFNDGMMMNPGHGTLVCSVVGSRGDVDTRGNVANNGAVVGSAPAAEVLPIRAIKSVVNFRQSTIPAAIAHAINQGADVIAMALGGPTRVASTERALRQAVEHGLVIVCAAGNCWPKVVFPAAYAAEGLCTAVAALTQSKHPWAKSGQGPQVTIAAPGENVWGASKNKASDPDNGVRASQGTTLATSLTAGVAALWVAHHGGRAALQAKARAAGTTVQAMFVASVTHDITKPGVWRGSKTLGAGMIDAEKTLAAPLPGQATGTEAVAAKNLGKTGVSPTLNTLITHLANHDPDALDDVGPEIADFAAEILWLSHRAGAKARAVETLGDEAAVGPDHASADLAAALSDKPHLQAVLRIAG